jgi:hypothetical protein
MNETERAAYARGIMDAADKIEGIGSADSAYIRGAVVSLLQQNGLPADGSKCSSATQAGRLAANPPGHPTPAEGTSSVMTAPDLKTGFSLDFERNEVPTRQEAQQLAASILATVADDIANGTAFSGDIYDIYTGRIIGKWRLESYRPRWQPAG